MSFGQGYFSLKRLDNAISCFYLISVLNITLQNIRFKQKEHLQEEFARALNTIGHDLDATLAHIENENIPKTNNWLELFFTIVFHKGLRID